MAGQWGARSGEAFRIVSADPSVTWNITGLCAGTKPGRILIELEPSDNANRIVAGVLRMLGIPLNTTGEEGSRR